MTMMQTAFHVFIGAAFVFIYFAITGRATTFGDSLVALLLASVLIFTIVGQILMK